jgi:glycosyltransferase involved in cell wall biosynthesis
MSTPQIAVVMSGFPRRSETFATNELLALADRGALAGIFATKPGDGSASPGIEKLQKFVHRLPNGSESEQGKHLASALTSRGVTALHGYFAHIPAKVAQLAAETLRIPFGFSVHAKDARKVLPDQLRERVQRAACVIACNDDVAATIPHASGQVELVPHGVDGRRFTPTQLPVAKELRILAVGRLVEKKGFQVLIDAVSRLKFPFQLRIVGEGPQENDLAQMILNKALLDCVTLVGPQTHEELPQEFARCHVLVVPSVVDSSGDRDGLPNVVLEAMASARPVIASDVGAISTAVSDGETGILIRMRDPIALAAALKRLASEPDLRERLGLNARSLVQREYDIGRCTERFYQVLQNAYT